MWAQPVTVAWQKKDLSIFSTGTASPTASSSSDLSSGAKAGIGVGVAVAVIIALALGIWVFWRRKRRTRALSEAGIKRKTSEKYELDGRQVQLAAQDIQESAESNERDESEQNGRAKMQPVELPTEPSEIHELE